MEVVRHTDSCRYPPVYIPHHPGLRDDSSTTHLRVVFNASSKTSNRTTLNDHLLTGPKLQADLSAIILRWRQHCYVYTADIAKMYRQIRVHRDDVDYQRILWRPDKNHPILVYRLLTLTYGTAPAPYLAMRVLQQLASDEGNEFPAAVNILENCIYVDDILFGADDLSSLRESRSQLIALCARGGFRPRKWAANQRELLADIPDGDHELAFDHPLNETDTLKVLGVTWLPDEDSFKFQTTSLPPSNHTKRTVLSFVARLFDPLGWATPVIIAAKIFMQDLWLRKIEWDDPIPDDLRTTWNDYYQNLHHLSDLRIPRWTGQYPDNLAIELHGFADASSRAYGAVVYAKVSHTYDTIQISLLAAKSKVAPLKTLSIPRLELCAAVLLTKLLKFVQDTLNLPHIPVCGWSDSTVALAWISQHPSKWKTFTANRVSDIQTRMPEMIWRHVDSKSNPADCASRGISAEELRQHPLWWTGPPWLSRPSAMWPAPREKNEVTASDYHTVIMSEMKSTTVCQTVQPIEEWDLLNHFSSWTRLIRVTAYIMRFVHNVRIQKTGGEPLRSDLSSQEIREARVFWIRSAQRIFFENELKALQAKVPISKSSPLLALNPTLGTDGLIRLGGRLKNSFLTQNEKHPIIIPRHRIAELIVSHAHTNSLHGGTQLTLRSPRQQFWVLGARTLVKSHIRGCVRCVRERATTATQIMGDLPSPRVNPSAPFSHTGVDYAGPMQVIPIVGRGQRSRKYYVAVFVCLSTKAVHLEYVDDYATTGFLAAFRRFVSRRGLPTDLYSDNGTNFKGADRELTKAIQALRQDPSWRDYFIEQEITWHFIPAAAPHIGGGLWEAAVKSFKFHLKRVVGNKTLAQIEFATLLCQIEACLNSRPLVALKDDPSDLEALTPGHFLIGRPLIGVPEQSVCELNENRLSRWQLVQAMRENIWRAWSHDYLHTLQQRNKWQTASPEIQPNELVLLKNNLLPPSKWELARVVDVHAGGDGHVRVVTVRTAQTSMKRPIAQICRLPIGT